MENLRNIIESLLFVSEAPLTVDKIKTVLETVDTKEIRANLNALADQYEARGGGFRLCEVAGGWQLRTRSKYHEYIKRMLQPPPQRLSRAALETLAIVAYNQPIIRADIEHIRGVDSGGMLRQLLERKLIRVLGRKEIPGRPLIYATAKLFLELFELKNLKDLPTPKEIEEMRTPTAHVKNTIMATAITDAPTTTSEPLSMGAAPPPPSPALEQDAMASSHATARRGYRWFDQQTAPFSTTAGRPAGIITAAQAHISVRPHIIDSLRPMISSTSSGISVESTDKSRPIPMSTNRTAAVNCKDKTATPSCDDKPKKP